MRKIPIVACNVGSPTVEMLIASAKHYAPDHELIVHYDEKTTFGETYNKVLDQVFERYDEVIVANDDIVLNPTCVQILMEDVETLKKSVGEDKLGFVGAMHDMARPGQNIRYSFLQDDAITFGKYKSENFIKQSPVIAPIFAYLSKKAYQVAKFPPITWYSDDIICEDLTHAGFAHFISRAYVHHVGSATIGTNENNNKSLEEALPWIYENRPQYIDELKRRLSFA